jgi:sugar phosphate isomerase/epimerase
MKIFIPILMFSAIVVGHAASFKDHLGLQMWSLRAQAKESTTGALDIASGYGVTEIEAAGTGELSAVDYRKELSARKLIAVGMHASYDVLLKDSAPVIANAKALGAKFIIVPWLPHDNKIGLTEDIARAAAVNFNKWGRECRAAGLQFGYHPHGYEFVTGADGKTLFDLIVRETNPKLVIFEMDVFWAFHAGQDPVKLLKKYPDRWRLMHVKDIRKGAVTGLSTGSAPPTDNVAVGDGQIDWPAVLRTAEKIGVQHYFIEDETVLPLVEIPKSLRYLRSLKL